MSDRTRGLIPWQPGQSGNPTGRPKGIAAQAKEHTGRCIEILAKGLESEDPRVSITAANSLLDRAYGKPITMSANVTEGLEEANLNELLAVLDELRAARQAHLDQRAAGSADTIN